MKEISVFDEAELRAQMQNMYKNIGYIGSLQCLYEIVISAKILLEVIKENVSKE